MIQALFDYAFLQNAFLAAILASIVCGIVGTIIVEKKIVSLSGGIAHASFGGIGLGYLLGIEPLIGGLLFAVGSSIGITTITRKTNTNNDALIGMFWSVGMALGILFIALTPGYPPDMTSYLFGDILTVSRFFIIVMTLLTLIIIACITCLFTYWKAYLFDEEFLVVLKIKVLFLEYFLYILLSLSIVILIKVVGIILAIALLTIPSSIGKLFTYDLKTMMYLSSFIGGIISILGLIVSYYFNIPSGAMIILIAFVFYCIASLFARRRIGVNNESTESETQGSQKL